MTPALQKQVGWVTALRDDRYKPRHHSRNRSCPMLRRLSVGLLASALAIAPLPTKAQDGTAEDLGDVMSVSLKDVVQADVGIEVRT